MRNLKKLKSFLSGGKIRWLFIVSVALLASPVGVSSVSAATAVTQQNEIITGTIVDSNGEPVIGANVIVQGQTLVSTK